MRFLGGLLRLRCGRFRRALRGLGSWLRRRRSLGRLGGAGGGPAFIGEPSDLAGAGRDGKPAARQRQRMGLVPNSRIEL